MRCIAIIQARMSSSRLPGKVLSDICGHPMLWHVLQRTQAINRLDGVVLAIPETPADDCLVEVAQERGIGCVRGSEYDVLQRYYRAAEWAKADVIVRVTADCPLFDPHIGNRALMEYLSTDADYVCAGAGMMGGVELGFPRGTDIEVFSYRVLDQVWRNASTAYDHEHVTPYIYQHPELFKLGIVKPIGKERSDLRLCVDTADDLKMVREIYSKLYKEGGNPFTLETIVNFLDRHPEIVRINANVKQKEG